MVGHKMMLLGAALGGLLVACGHGDRADAARKSGAKPATSANHSSAPARNATPTRVAKRVPSSAGPRKTATKPAAKPAAKPVTKSASGTVLALKVPEAHLPPPGQCRIWNAGATAFQQPQSRSCDGINRTAPAGAMILDRPSKDPKIVRVRYLDQHRAGLVVRVRVFEAATGKYLRDEKV